MITKITGEQPFQVLTNNFSISPSNEGYTLQISADGKQYSNLFTVGAGVTRLVTGVAANSYYRLSGNQSNVSINWMKVCVTEGGGGASGTELSPVSEFPAGAEAGTVIAYSGSSSAAGIYQFDGTDWVEAGGSVDLSAYWTSAQTQSAITAVEDHLFDVEEVTASALTELHEGLLELSARTGGNSNILAAISSQTEYEAISGSVKSGDLIQVYDVDINGDGDNEYGLFEAEVQEEEDGPGGDIIRIVYWERRDNRDSVTWAYKVYTWMADNDVWPVDFGENSFLISTDDNSEDEAYNGIGFDADGKPVITHISPEYDEQTGEITGVTREDRDILGELDTLDEVVSAALVDLNEKKVESQDIKHIVKLTQAEYDQLATKDPETFYIIINNNN